MELTQGVRFDSLGLSEPILRAIEKKGYEVSTPIQAGAIPPMLEWRDVTAKAPTGTGKRLLSVSRFWNILTRKARRSRL